MIYNRFIIIKNISIHMNDYGKYLTTYSNILLKKIVSGKIRKIIVFLCKSGQSVSYSNISGHMIYHKSLI